MAKDPEARMCPVCGSEQLKSLYQDGVKTYRCINGHTFIIEKIEKKGAGED